MYIGSVRFFKHLILTVLALLIIIPTTGFVYFAYQYQNLKNQIAAQAEVLQQGQAALSEDAVLSDDKENTQNNPVLAVYAADHTSDTAETGLLYQLEYPQLYVENDFTYKTEAEKTIYLTFDDGPTELTPQILDILKDHDVKATFFVVYRDSDEAKLLYKRIVDEGHTLALHSATHNYKKIYQSVESFLDDYATLSDMLFEVTGTKPELFRFPGGSVNNYNKEIYQELIAEMLRRGYTYYDWDASAGSSTSTATADSIYSNVMNGVSGKQRAIVLMHDAGTRATVSVLPKIIDSLKASGYKLEVLDKNIRPANFDYSY